MNKGVKRIPTHELIRELPKWAKVVKTINNIDIRGILYEYYF